MTDLSGLTDAQRAAIESELRDMLAVHRSASMDPESAATISKMLAKQEALEAETEEAFEVELDPGFEFTAFGFTEIDLEECKNSIAWMEDLMPFPGSVNIEPLGEDWAIERSDGRELSFTGLMGWVRYEEGRIFQCVFTNGPRHYRANVVRDPEFDPAAEVVRPLWIHRG